MWWDEPILIILLFVSSLLITCSYEKKGVGILGALIGVLLLSATIGYALVCGVDYKQCAVALLVLLVIIIHKRSRK